MFTVSSDRFNPNPITKFLVVGLFGCIALAAVHRTNVR